jgi:plastocyanin
MMLTSRRSGDDGRIPAPPLLTGPRVGFVGRCTTRMAFAFIAAFLCLSGRAATFNVSVEDNLYVPEQLAINVGDTVKWTGNGGDHTVNSDTSLFDAETTFGVSFSYTFTQAGTYGYHCAIHGGAGNGMFGTIVVSASSANQPPAAPVNQSPAIGATNQALTLQLSAGAFSDPDAQDFHAASQWVVRRVSDSQIVYDSGEDSTNKVSRPVPAGLLQHGTAYNWQVRYKDGRGLWSSYSTPTTFSTLVPFVQEGVGLKASYNNIADFAAPLVVTTNATINYQWGNTRPNRRITADGFGVRWEGSVLPQFSERYEFQFQFRGGARVWVNNQLLIDDWAVCSFGQTRRCWADLVGGQRVALRVEYAADPGGAQAVLRWTSPSVALEVVPSAKLFPTAP